MIAADELQIFNSQLERVLADYETGRRDPQRAMEIISCLLNELGEPVQFPLSIQAILLAVFDWSRGDRPDIDVLATIAALSRLSLGLGGGATFGRRDLVRLAAGGDGGAVERS